MAGFTNKFITHTRYIQVIATGQISNL